MSAKDKPKSKPATDAYRDNWGKIFDRTEEKPLDKSITTEKPDESPTPPLGRDS